jgi:CubicO group peptidase (beta-lactamase class C family)
MKQGRMLIILGMILAVFNVAKSAQQKSALQAPFAKNAGPTDPKELEIFLDRFLSKEKSSFSGAAFVLVKDSTIFFQKGYGYVDQEKKMPVTPDQTMLYAASVAKLFTATAVMQLVEQGKLRLDADVNHYLKKFQLDSDYPQPVTVAHLLTHTGGIDERSLGVLARNAAEVIPLGDYFAKHPPRCVMSPGGQINYSNHGMALAGYLVEAVTGLSFAEYVEQQIFKPLGMQHSSFRQPLPPVLAAAIIGGAPAIIPYPAGSLVMTTTDMAPFMIAHLNAGRFGNQRLLQEATVRLMHQQHFTPHPDMPGVAYGFFESFINNRRGLYHTGDRGHHSLLYLLPDEHLGFYFVCIASDEAGIQLREKLSQAFLDHYYPVDEKFTLPQPRADLRQRAHLFTGLYRPVAYSHQTIAKLPMLMADFRITDNGDGTLTAHPPWGDMKMVEVEPFLFRVEDGTYIAFREDGHGGIINLFISGGISDPGTAERLPWYESGSLHLRLAGVGFIIFLLRVLIWPLRDMVKRLRKQERTPETATPQTARLAWRLSGGVSGLVVLCPFILLAWAITKPWPIFDVPPTVVVILSLLLIASMIGLALPIFVVLAWKRSYWSLGRRLHFSFIALAAFIMVPWLYYWNLLGFRF